MKKIDGIPRRIRTDLYTHAEKAISAAIDAVELSGADPLLTDAVMLLSEAKSKVADHTEKQDLWQCSVCGNVMTEAQSKGYLSCPTGRHGCGHVRLVFDGDKSRDDVPWWRRGDMASRTGNLAFEIITNGHLVTAHVDEMCPVRELKCFALVRAQYDNADADRWQLLDDAGAPVTAERAHSAPRRMYLNLPAGMGA